MSVSLKNCLVLSLFAVALTALAGCDTGPEYFPVSGTVEFKIDGSTAQFGTIEFRSETEPPVIARGNINKDGTYRVDATGKTGTIAGSHTVVIIQVVGDSRSGKVIHNHGLEVAKKYQDHRTTDLVVELNKESGANLKLEVDSKDE